MWRFGDSYLSMPFYFPRKRGGGGLTSPHPPGAVLLLFVQVPAVSKQSTLLGGEGGSRNRLL